MNSSDKKPRYSVKFGLGFKFVLLVIVILSITLSVTTRIVNQSQNQHDHDQLTEKLNLLGDFVALISTEAILSYNYQILEEYMKEAVNRPDMIYGVVLDPNGVALTSYIDSEKPEIKAALEKTKSKNIEETLIFIKENNSIIHKVYPVKLEEDLIGSVVLGISKNRLATLAEASLLELTSINGTIILFLSITLYLVFRHSALKPIRSLMNGSARIAKGNFETPVETHSRDELGELSDSFNQMMTQLKHNILEKDNALNQLSDLNSTLEERVESRTNALQESEARIRTIYDNIGEGIIVIDDKGFIETVNRSAIRIFDTSEENIVGIHVMLLLANNMYGDIVTEDEYVDKEKNPFKSTKNRSLVETEGITLSGRLFPMEVVVTEMELASSKLRVCIVRDISKRKDFESKLAESQQRVVEAAHQSGMAEMATGVLHNIGNVLNSVSVSVEVITRTVKTSNISGLIKANKLLTDNIDNIGDFMQHDNKGKKLPEYLNKLGSILDKDIEEIKLETDILNEKVTMIKEVISTQQSYAKAGSFVETFDISTIVDDALKVQEASLYKSGVATIKNFESVPKVLAQKSKLLQVVTNLIKNAQEAMSENDIFNKIKEITVSIGKNPGDSIFISVKDTGCGIEEDKLSEIFSHGFTTKETGHGFGLHASANAMTEMSGRLIAVSDGKGMGSCFTLSLPICKDGSQNIHEETKKAS